MRNYTHFVPVALLLFFLLPLALPAQEVDSLAHKRGRERFEALAWLEGEWQGYGKFTERVTYIRKHYSFDVGGIYFVERTLDMFPPVQPTVEFEMHQDLTLFYRTSPEPTIRAQGFYVEGFVISSSVRVEDGGSKLTIVSEKIENAPPGLRTRYTMTREGPDKFSGLFEMAMPEKDFAVIERLEMKRIR